MTRYNTIEDCIPEWLTRSANTLVIIFDNKGKLTYANDRFSQLMKLPKEGTLPTISSLIQYPSTPNSERIIKLLRKNEYHLVLALKSEEDSTTPLWSTWDFNKTNINGNLCYIGIGKEVKYFDLMGGKTMSSSISHAISKNAILSAADQEGRIIMANDNFCRTTKFSREEIMGKRHRELIHDYQSSSFWRTMLQKLVSGETWQDDVRIQAKDGKNYWLRTLVSPVLDESGKLFQVLYIQFDITAHKNAEAENMKLLRRYDNITSHLPGFAYQYKLQHDHRHFFPFVSEGMTKLLGIAEQEANENADLFFKRIHPDDIDNVLHSKENSSANLHPWNIQFRMLDAHDHVIWVQNISTPERMIDGSIMWHGFCYDITEIKSSEQNLADREQRLADIAFIQSHEFRRPIANMLGIFDIMYVQNDISDNEPEGSIGKWLHLLHQSVKETDAIIAKIVTRAEEDKQQNSSLEHQKAPSNAPKY